MIYIKNTTDAQVIFIDRETQSIDNISPITLDSNYYTKVEVDVIAQRTLEQSKEYTNNLANEYYDIAEEYIDSNIERLENRIDELENNGGSSTDKPTHVITIYGGFQLTFAQIFEIKQKFETHKVMVKSIDTKISIVEIINVVYNSSNSNYFAVYGISENKLYEWKFDTTTTFINPTIIILGGGDTSNLQDQIDVNHTLIGYLEDRVTDLENNGGGSSGGDTTELENRVTDIENRAFNNINSLENQIEALDNRVVNLENNGGGDTTNLQEQITANTTRINNVERVIVLDVSNGMSSTHFNTIFNDFKSKNYKYLLNVGNNDFFNICSIQDANRSITAIGFDDYEGELMCYNWFAPQQASVPELTKRKIITEIV